MSALNIPDGYQQVMPYLIVKSAANFLAFMQTVFSAAEKMKVMRNESDIMHGELQVGQSTIMFADATDEFPVQTAGMFIYVADCDSTYDKALNNGATPIMPPADQEYGRCAGIKDSFGNTWWITAA